MTDVLVRKTRAGSDSHGHVWDTDGSTISMPYEQAIELVRIRDGGFVIVEPALPDDPAAPAEPAPPPASRRRGTRHEITE